MYGNNDYRDYLMHHGIKGQKWGVENGPPYPLNSDGKKRFTERLAERRKAKKKQEALKKARKARAKSASEKAKDEAKAKKTSVGLSPTPTKKIKKMSTAELEARIKRLQMEKQLRDLEAGDKSRAAKMVSDGLYEGGKQLISKAVSEVGMYYIKQAFSAASNDSGKKKEKNSSGGGDVIKKQKVTNISLGGGSQQNKKKK